MKLSGNADVGAEERAVFFPQAPQERMHSSIKRRLAWVAAGSIAAVSLLALAWSDGRKPQGASAHGRAEAAISFVEDVLNYNLPPGKKTGYSCMGDWKTPGSPPAHACTAAFPTCVGFKPGEQWGRCVRTCSASHTHMIGDPAEVGGGVVSSYADLCPRTRPVCSRSGTCSACRDFQHEDTCSENMCMWRMGQCMSLPWDFERVERMCANVGGATARRLGELGEDQDELELEQATPRQLRPAAKFNPKFLKRIEVGIGASMPYYGSVDLTHDVPMCAVTALISIHGIGRNAQDYFCSLKKIVEASELKLNETIMVVPKFTYEVDQRERHDLWWNGSRPYGQWHIGGDSDVRSGTQMPSFEVLDQILVYLSNRKFFPCMKAINVIGHSAGGQTVMRYSMLTHLLPSNEATEQTYLVGDSVRPGVTVQYVIANPSSYTYLDANRWSYDCGTLASPEGCTEPAYQLYLPQLGRRGWKEKAKLQPGGFNDPSYAPWTPGTPFICQSPSFNDYEKGLDVTMSELPYLRYIGWHLKRYPLRNIIFIVGQNDTCTDNNLPFCFASCWKRNRKCARTAMDMRCGAMLQGPNRNQRGLNFMRHLFFHYGQQVHKMYVIPGAGHEAEKMMISAVALKRSATAHQYEVHVAVGGVSIGEQV
mmetsp:Transcript_3274/g.8858  ORF Transcript_3274/g.8858 Transcript_3274/m.8858 type:complete len:650 (+) Transcript_3274:80-2029(+)